MHAAKESNTPYVCSFHTHTHTHGDNEHASVEFTSLGRESLTIAKTNGLAARAAATLTCPCLWLGRCGRHSQVG